MSSRAKRMTRLPVSNKMAINQMYSDFVNKHWDPFWKIRVPAGATYNAININGAEGTDPASGFYGDVVYVDTCFQVLARNIDPVKIWYQPGAWEDRDSGTTPIQRVRIPNGFVLADATPGDTPNNATIIANIDSGEAYFMNACARPTNGGNIWAYKADRGLIPGGSTHGGSYTSGGEINGWELRSGYIPHAIGILVWGRKYLSNNGTGFVSPAYVADGGYDNPASGNYYGGNITTLKMGTRVAIPPGTSAASLGVTSKPGLAVYQALVSYGAYIIDNTAFDGLALCATRDGAESTLYGIQPELEALFSAMQLVA